MKKRIGMIIAIAALMIVSVALLSGCFLNSNNSDTDTSGITGIQVSEEIIHMSLVGETSTYQLAPVALPEGTSASFAYMIPDSGDLEYLSVSADGLLTAKAVKAESITVRIKAKGTSITKDIAVYVEKVGAKSISLTEKSISLELGSNSYKLYPTLEPSNASANLMYASKNEKVCRVDGLGNITPVGTGKTEVTVSTSDTESGDTISATIVVTVKYAPLAYKIDLTCSESALKQIEGSPEEITAKLVAESSYCDQNPTIKWYCDGVEITALAGKKDVSYTPSGLTIGKQCTFYARVIDEDGNVLNTYDEQQYNIAVYKELTRVTAAIPAGKVNTYSQYDVVTADVSFDTKEYPAEQYKWYVKKSGVETYVGITNATTFTYTVTMYGDVSLVCVPVVKGVDMTALKSEVSLGSVAESLVSGCEIYNVYIEGGEYATDTYLPLVLWDSVARPGAEIRVTVSVGGTEYLMNSSNPDYSGYFTGYGCYIPTSIVPNFNTSFNVTVGTDGHQSAYPAYYVAGTITSDKYEYLDEIIDGTGMNGYISNIEELGKLLNYISLFRPSDLYKTESDNTIVPGNTGYSFKAYMTFKYADLAAEIYPIMSEPSAGDAENLKDLHRIVSAAFNCYCDTATFSYARIIDGNVASLCFDFTDALTNPVQIEDTYHLQEVYADQSYATGDEVRTSDALPIDSVTATMSVTTSNQLYYALSLGYKPLPTAGSAAETVYAKMRAVLKRICSDSFTEAQKVHAIYDFLSTEVTYDYSTLNVTNPDLQSKSEAFCLEGVFLRGRAVCDGISKSFNSLCRMEGIAAIKVSGFESVGGVNHAWNKVLVDGKWYGIDATWGSSRSSTVEYQNHLYLMTTDAVLNEKHTTYGKTPDTETVASEVYYKSELVTGADHTVGSTAEAATIGTQYCKPRLVNANDSVILEVKLGGTMTINDITNTISNALSTISRTLKTVTLNADTYLIIITKTN